MELGYARVSTTKQDLDRQIDALTTTGIAPGHVYVDKKSGATTDRAGLKALLGYARGGDVIVVHTLDRLGRTVRDTLNLRCGRNTAETGHATPDKSLTWADAAGCQRRRWDSVSAGVGANSTLGSRSSRVVGARSGGVRLRVQFPNRRTVWVM